MAEAESNEIPKKNRIIALLIVIVLTSGVTFCSTFVLDISTPHLRLMLHCLIYVALVVPSLVAFKLTGGRIKDLLAAKNKTQYFYAIALFAFLFLIIALIPALCGFSLIGGALKFDVGLLLDNALFYIVFVGPVEEFVFRVYIQDTFVNLLHSHKWLAPLFSSLVFGFWHLILGSWVQVLFTFLIGLAFGYAKYLFKNCSFISTALGHGLYDFFNVIIRMFVIG